MLEILHLGDHIIMLLSYSRYVPKYLRTFCCLFWDQEIVLKVILHFSQKTFLNSIALLKQKEKKTHAHVPEFN